MNSKDHYEQARDLMTSAQHMSDDYSHQGDRATPIAITALTQAVLALYDPLERLAGATEKLAEWGENNWRLRD